MRPKTWDQSRTCMDSRARGYMCVGVCIYICTYRDMYTYCNTGKPCGPAPLRPCAPPPRRSRSAPTSSRAEKLQPQHACVSGAWPWPVYPRACSLSGHRPNRVALCVAAGPSSYPIPRQSRRSGALACSEDCYRRRRSKSSCFSAPFSRPPSAPAGTAHRHPRAARSRGLALVGVRLQLLPPPAAAARPQPLARRLCSRQGAAPAPTPQLPWRGRVL